MRYCRPYARQYQGNNSELKEPAHRDWGVDGAVEDTSLPSINSVSSVEAHVGLLLLQRASEVAAFFQIDGDNQDPNRLFYSEVDEKLADHPK